MSEDTIIMRCCDSFYFSGRYDNDMNDKAGKCYIVPSSSEVGCVICVRRVESVDHIFVFYEVVSSI